MIISGASADAEISKVKPAEVDDAGLPSFAYLRLDDENFERLSYALAKSSAPHAVKRTWDDAALMVRGADAGRVCWAPMIHPVRKPNRTPATPSASDSFVM